jgi:hypothetical protein
MLGCRRGHDVPEYLRYAAGARRLCNGSAGHDCAAASRSGCGDDPSKIEPGHCADLSVMRKVMWSYHLHNTSEYFDPNCYY